MVGSSDKDVGAGEGEAAPVLASLLFAPNQRPDARAIASLAEGGAFGISHGFDAATQSQEPGWLELIITGLTFDLHGLAPGVGGHRSDFVHRYGMAAERTEDAAEALTLSVGPHLAGAEGLLPVVRAAAGLAQALSALPGALAVGWHPARALSGVGHFTSSVGGWLAGGAFPALGLTALARSPDGAMTSEGLRHLIGQELRLEPRSGSSPSEDARLAVRLIDRLVATGPLKTGETLGPIAGHLVDVEPDPAARLVRARRR
jgi:hypothetical protein